MADLNTNCPYIVLKLNGGLDQITSGGLGFTTKDDVADLQYLADHLTLV